jgi:hypothetical protein
VFHGISVFIMYGGLPIVFLYVSCMGDLRNCSNGYNIRGSCGSVSVFIIHGDWRQCLCVHGVRGTGDSVAVFMVLGDNLSIFVVRNENSRILVH